MTISPRASLPLFSLTVTMRRHLGCESCLPPTPQLAPPSLARQLYKSRESAGRARVAPLPPPMAIPYPAASTDADNDHSNRHPAHHTKEHRGRISVAYRGLYPTLGNEYPTLGSITCSPRCRRVRERRVRERRTARLFLSLRAARACGASPRGSFERRFEECALGRLGRRRLRGGADARARAAQARAGVAKD